jgi:hypothetical protein
MESGEAERMRLERLGGGLRIGRCRSTEGVDHGIHAASRANAIGQRGGGIGHGIKRWIQCGQTQGNERAEIAGTMGCVCVLKGVCSCMYRRGYAREAAR